MRPGDLWVMASVLTTIACVGCTTAGSGGPATIGGGGAGAGGSAATGGSAAGGSAAGGSAAGGSAAGGSAGSSGLDGGGCVPPAPGDLAGSYLFTLSLSSDRRSPILFVAQTSTVPSGGGSALELTLQALDATDRKTPVGNPITLPPIAIGNNGQLDSTKQLDLQIDGRANAVQPGLAIVATVTLHGQVCGVADFYCGTVGGQVNKPITIQLTGSTYTLDHIAAPTSLPYPPLIDCAKLPAGPPP